MKAKRKLIKVTSESELRTGMLIVLKRCAVCSRDHELMLGNKIEETGCDEHGADHQGSWCLLIGRPCKRTMSICLTHSAIPDGRLYRVEDGIDEEIAADKKKKNQEKLDDLVNKVRKFKEFAENAQKGK